VARIVPFSVDVIKNFKTRFWDYYADLFKYKEHPKLETTVMLSSEFDKLFSWTTRKTLTPCNGEPLYKNKRKIPERFTDKNLYPYSKFYLGEIKQGSDSTFLEKSFFHYRRYWHERGLFELPGHRYWEWERKIFRFQGNGLHPRNDFGNI